MTLLRSLPLVLSLVLGSACSGGADDDEGGFTFGTSYTTTAATVGDGDGDMETSAGGSRRR